MSLWARRIGQLALVSVALFFFSCQEDTSVLGFKNPNGKFKVNYVEIPIESSIFLRDSLRTSNYTYSGEVNRYLVGHYTDPVFGDVSASTFTQYFTANYEKLGSTAEFDSATLELQFDLYTYGSMSTDNQDISVYELDRALTSDSLRYYYANSNIPYTKLLGTKSFSISPEDFNDFAGSSTDYDTIITVSVPLITSFGQKIFDSAIRYRDATSKEDSAFVLYSEFVKQFRGLAIKPENSDKIIGFNPVGSKSRIVIHYHEATEDSLTFNLGMSGVIGFNQIQADRSATELSEVSTFYQSYEPDTEKRYIESGVGLLTKLDISNFYAFADTIPNMLINSAELVVEAEDPGIYTPPASFSMRVLKDNNRMKQYNPDNSQDVADLSGYSGYLQVDAATLATPLVDNDSVLFANDRNALLSYNATNLTYNGFFTLFFQQLTLNNENTKYRNFVLCPGTQAATRPLAQHFAKTVNRVILPKDKIKLKIYYTKPTTNQ